MRRALYGRVWGVPIPSVFLLRDYVRWVLRARVDNRCACGHSSAAAEDLDRDPRVVNRAEAEAFQDVVELDELVCGECELRLRRDFRIGRNCGNLDGDRAAVRFHEGQVRAQLVGRFQLQKLQDTVVGQTDRPGRRDGGD